MAFHAEERIARSFYKDLATYFPTTSVLPGKQKIELSVAGLGVHWHCLAAGILRNCTIHCFDIYPDHEAEYLIEYQAEDECSLWGRSRDQQQVRTSVLNWLNNHSIPSFYEAFPFIDAEKRKLQTIDRALKTLQPELEQLQSRIIHELCDSYTYQITHNNRSCNYNGQDSLEDAHVFDFSWENSQLFQVTADDYRQLATPIKNWLIDYLDPSELELTHPWIKVGELARYYERGEGVLGEFIESWQKALTYFDAPRFEYRKNICRFINHLRQLGFDRIFRAGTSLDILLLSRSRRHGLSPDMPYVGFDFGRNQLTLVYKFDTYNSRKLPSIEVTDEILQLLSQLMEYAIT